ALEQLRAKLESQYGGDRRALALALLPLAKLPVGAAVPTLLGVPLMNVLIGTSAVTLLTVAASVGLSREHRASAPPPLLPAAAELEPVAATTGELQAPATVPQDPRTQSAPLVASVQDSGKQKAKHQDDKNVWKTELSHVQALPATVQSIGVNTGSGDIELAESTSGQLEIVAKVRAQLGKVDDAKLTQVFEDHVDV